MNETDTGGLPYPAFVRSLSGPLGCLAVLLLFPIALLSLLFVAFRGGMGATAAQRRPRTKEEVDREVALCSLVQAMALDAEFGREDARTAGVMAAAGRTPDEMLDEAVRRGWVETRGERLAVTERGRRTATAYLRSLDLD